ncbi:MAG: hypothetical protein Tsb0020_18020 [Haliangiales bacterium]
MAEREVITSAELRVAIAECRAAVESHTPPEYDRLVFALADGFRADAGLYEHFMACAQALRCALTSRYLDEEIQDLQWQLQQLTGALAQLAAAAAAPRGLGGRPEPTMWPGLPWSAGELPDEIERSLSGIGRFIQGVDQELDEAGRVQRMLLPKHGELVTEAAHLAGFYRPAQGCGGDFWTAERLPDQRLLLVVGDVTGHGSAAAIITGVARAACDALLASGVAVTCSGLLEYLNQAIYRVVAGEVHMTAVVAIIDPVRAEMSTANAGHPLPYLLSRGDDFGNLRQIIVRGTPLGASDDSSYETVVTALSSGDLVLWYSDGITECCDSEGVEFGERALRQLLRASATRSAVHLRDEVVAHVGRFCADAVLKDDVTVVAGVMMPMQRLK